MPNVAIKYRLYPTKEQTILFAKTFGCCRKVYNLMLSSAIDEYRLTGKFNMKFPASFKKEYPYLKEVDSLALANKGLDLISAFKNCFSKSCKKRNAFPKFKSAKHSRKAYTTNNQKGTIAIIGNFIKLPKVKLVKAVIHRIPEESWIIKSATVSQASDGKFYASVLFEYSEVINNYKPAVNNAIGLDYSSESLFVSDNGELGFVDSKDGKYYRKSHKQLARQQRKLSRKIGSRKDEQKSNNYLKQLHKVNAIHRYIANQRLDFLHKKSTEIANRYDVVCIESLNMKAIGNHKGKLGKVTFDNAYGMFTQMLEYKLKCRNKHFVKVDKWFPSSQLCSCCGYKNILVKDRKVREWDCPSCNTHHNRDVNAAVNIKVEGLRMLCESVAG